MKKTFLLFFVALALFAGIQGAQAATFTYTWTGLGGNSNWNNNANWIGSPLIGATFPKAGDAAQIGVLAFAGAQPTINTTGLTCATLTIGNLTAVTLTVSNAFTLSGAITINGAGTFTGGQTISAASITVNAFTLNVNTPLSVSGSFTAASGSTVNSNSSGTIAAATMGITSSTFSLGATNTISGALTINNGTTTTYNSTALTTAASMTTNTVTLALGGALSISGSTTVKGTTINGSAVASINTAGISMTSANVTLNGVLTSTSVVQVPTPGGTDCTLTTNAIGNVIAGVYDHTGSNLTWNGSGTTTCSQGDVSSGQTLTIGAGNTINFTGALELHASAVDGNLVNNGNITMTNSSLFSDNLSSGTTTPITNNTGGTITLTGSSAQLSAGAFASISNSGTISAGTNTTISIGGHAVMVNNSDGEVDMNKATMSLAANASLNNTGDIFAITSSNITTGNPGAITNNNGGLISLTTSTMTLNGSGTLINSGTITASSTSTINTNNPTTVTNNATGLITVTGSTLNFNAGTSSITNSGQINANALSTINTGNPAPITNNSTGSISLSASTLNLNGGSYVKNSGSVSAVSGSTITIQNSAYVNDLTSASTFTVSASTLDLEAGAAVINSGTFITNLISTVKLNGNTAPITNNVNSTFTADTTTFTMVAGSSITNTGGTATMKGCTINGSGNATTITNQNSGAVTGVYTMDNTAATFTGTGIITNSGTFTANNGTSINMTSTAASGTITNTGTFYAGTKSSPCIITLNGTSPKLTNGSAGVAGNFYLGSSSILYPTSTSTLVTNTVSTPTTSLFVLQSDSTGTAAIGAVPVGANPNPSLVGIFNVERYFQGSTVYDNTKGRWLGRNYRIISSPVNIGTATKISGNNISGLNYIVGTTAGQTTTANSAINAFITGCIGGSTTAGNPSIYLYKESIVPSNTTFTSGNFLGITNITNSTSAGTITASDGSIYSMPVGTGQFFFFRGAATNFATRTAAPFIAPEDVTFTSTGSLNQGSITFKDWYNPGVATLGYTVTGVGTGANTNTAVRGFNLIGNPYPCSIDWNTINTGGLTAVNVNPTVYVFDPVTNQYDTYNSTTTTGNPANTNGIIESGQGFFVQGNKNIAASNSSLTINESAKSPTSQRIGPNLLMGTPAQSFVAQLLRLRLTIDTLNYDDIVIGFNSSASTKYNNTLDAVYLPGLGAMEGLSSFSADSVPLAMNFLPLPKQTARVVNLDVEGRKTGEYTLKKTALDPIPQLYDIWLMDKYKKDSLDIRRYPAYVFDIDLADTNSYGKNRFQLVIRQNPALAVHLLNFTASKTTSGSQTSWKTENEQDYTNFTVEKSSDQGANFVVLSGFASNAGGSYSFLDKNPQPGTYQYRLKMQDLNGTITYSNIVTLSYGNSPNVTASNISVYPNPASSVINLSIDQKNVNTIAGFATLQTSAMTPALVRAATIQSYTIKIINVTGTVVKSVDSATSTWQNNVSNLAPGTYVIQVVNNTQNSIVGQSTFVKL